MPSSIAQPNGVAGVASRDASPKDILLLFGPQSTRLSDTYLSEIRDQILKNPDLAFLADVVSELPSLWPTITGACAATKIKIPGEEKLNELRDFFLLHDNKPVFPNLNEASNLTVAPLTVLSHLVEFWRLHQTPNKKIDSVIFPSSSSSPSSCRLRDVQGFCMGFLAAANVASSRTALDFRKSASAAVRLAVCIGVVVDLDEASMVEQLDGTCSLAVRWKSEAEFDYLTEALGRYPEVSGDAIALNMYLHTSFSQ